MKNMLRQFRSILWALAIVGIASRASAFSLLGPVDAAYQTAAIGYNPINTDIGGPMSLGEEYRWNLKVIYYGFDPSFVNYFGKKGMDEVNKAIAILNALPPMSALSSNLAEYPTDTRRVNSTASALGLWDLKSIALAFLLEEMGLASPERYVWTLRDRRTINNVIFYLVIMRNFDPATLSPSPYVNDELYTYSITDPITLVGGQTFADAVERPIDPVDFGFRAVVSAADGFWGGQLLPGEFFTGLTRDDVGALRYIYTGKNTKRQFFANYNTENLISTAITNGVFSSGGAWTPAGTGTPVSLALRAGVDKIVFKQLQYPSTFGTFIPITNNFKDSYINAQNRSINQSMQRAINFPDIVFAAGDLGVDAGGNPLSVSRTTGFINNAAINTTPGGGGTPTAGPGQIEPTAASPVFITFSKLGPAFQNASSSFLDQSGGLLDAPIWGSYDGTTNPPTIYPNGSSIQDLVQQVFGGGSN